MENAIVTVAVAESGKSQNVKTPVITDSLTIQICAEGNDTKQKSEKNQKQLCTRNGKMCVHPQRLGVYITRLTYD